MAKNTRSYDDEIDLIELVQVFLTHKTEYILFGLVGLMLGLVFTYQHEPRFETEFKVYVGHPAFSNQFLIMSSAVQALLDEGELNKKKLPHYSFNKKTELLTVTTASEGAPQVVSEVFTNALQQEVVKLKSIATSFEGFDNKPVILNNDNNKNNLTWTNKDIATLDPDQVVQSLKISFSEPRVQYPNPFKHGVIGVFVGLVLAFLWMVGCILIGKLREKSQ
jgi:hypothetical protein